jgi:AraC-like DNA-binding protein
MDYREHRLPRSLDPFVECVWFLNASPDGNNGGEPATQRILPDGCAELIFHFHQRFHAVSAVGFEPQPAGFLVGLLTSPLVVAPAADVDTMAVRFRPGGAYPFFGVPMSALTDRAVSLDDLWGRRAASRLWEALAARDGAARLATVVRELERRVARTEADAATSAAVAALVATAGRARIEAIAGRSGTTTRQLQRRFAERVGVSPKVLARILRFQRTLLHRSAGEPSRTDWVHVAVECGYADQSHLIHDYAEFAGGTPASLRAAEGELSAYFTAPSRLASLFGLPSCLPPARQKL